MPPCYRGTGCTCLPVGVPQGGVYASLCVYLRRVYTSGCIYLRVYIPQGGLYLRVYIYLRVVYLRVYPFPFPFHCWASSPFFPVSLLGSSLSSRAIPVSLLVILSSRAIPVSLLVDNSRLFLFPFHCWRITLVSCATVLSVAGL